jgi:putative membrane protein
MNNSLPAQNGRDKFYTRLIGVVSVVVFLLVVLLSQLPKTANIPSFVKYLPRLNAILNGTCTVILLTSFYFIRRKKVSIHKRLNITAVVLSTVFLLSYVLFHSFGVETRYGDINHDGIVDALEKDQAGNLRMVYFVILSTHIVLAAIVLPLVLLSLYRGITNQVSLHRKIVRWSFPVWLYVTTSGVIVYLMISPYYNF